MIIFFTCDAIDEAGCKAMLRCIKELNKAKVTTQLYEFDEDIDLQLLKNWIDSSREISHEVDAEMVLESENVNYDAFQELHTCGLWSRRIGWFKKQNTIIQ